MKVARLKKEKQEMERKHWLEVQSAAMATKELDKKKEMAATKIQV